jgi:hypothetical protein
VSAAGESLTLSNARPAVVEALKRAVGSPRLYIYLACTVLAVLTSYHLGKEMLWDTMDYHVYAGFTALHDRFGQDYFAAGPQAYFNPYAYVPFYLLLRSRLTALADASILAVLQSAILWLTYELAMAAAPGGQPRVRLAVGTLAVTLAFANPVLIFQLGSSYADVTTAEVALAGWLMLLAAVRTPGTVRVVCGALLLGAASALKLTNAVHAVAAVALLYFIPGSWSSRFRYAALFAVGIVAGFVLVSAPWSLRLQQHFGNPLFPLLNGVFRSPEYSTAPMVAYRFIPDSFGAALLRPFTMVLPLRMIHVEGIAPDLRYALLLILVLLLTLRWARRRVGDAKATIPSTEDAAVVRALAALGCGFFVDWVLWLTVSGNSRYFMPMACVAAVLDVALIFRLFARRLAARNCLLAAVFGVQIFQLCAGTEYRDFLPWGHGPWFTLTVPSELASQPSLYFMLGEQANSFIIPYMPADSGFINLDGEYALDRNGPNGQRIESLIKRFAPHLRVLVPDPRGGAGEELRLPDPMRTRGALEPFGLQVDTSRCTRIVAHGVSTVAMNVASTGHESHQQVAPAAHTEYFVTCHLAWNASARALPLPGQRAADLAFDHLEDACPALFQPRRPADTFLGDDIHGYVFARRYPNTEILAWIGHGWVRFQNFGRGGQEQDAGAESDWEKEPLRVACGRTGQGFLRLLHPKP